MNQLSPTLDSTLLAATPENYREVFQDFLDRADCYAAVGSLSELEEMHSALLRSIKLMQDSTVKACNLFDVGEYLLLLIDAVVQGNGVDFQDNEYLVNYRSGLFTP